MLVAQDAAASSWRFAYTYRHSYVYRGGNKLATYRGLHVPNLLLLKITVG